MKRSRRVQSLVSLASLTACAAYGWAYLRYDWHGARTLAAATISGVTALVAFAYGVARPRFHARVTLFLLGAGAVVATACAALFLYCGWTDRERLADLSLLPIIALFTLLAAGAAVFTWLCFWSLVGANRTNPKT